MRVESKQASKVMRPDSPHLSALFSNPAFAAIWLVVRVFVGWQWLSSGYGKLQNPAWMSTGTALQGFWERAVTVPASGKPVIAYDWYSTFIESLLNGGHYAWFAKLVVFGEVAVGVTLILGAFVGVAALFGAFMNLNFMLAGTASTNPVLFTLAILLILAWKIAGHWGLDRWLLPTVQTPWEWVARPVNLRSYPRSS